MHPARSYLPSWISASLQRSRLPSSAGGGSEDGGAPSLALATPHLGSAIHGSLHGGKAFPPDRKRGGGGGGGGGNAASSHVRAAASGLNVLGAPSAHFPLKDVSPPGFWSGGCVRHGVWNMLLSCGVYTHVCQQVVMGRHVQVSTAICKKEMDMQGC